MNSKLLLTLTFATTILAGCSTQTYRVNGDLKSFSAPDKDQMQHFFISGLGQEQELDAAKICGGADKVVAVQSKHEFVDGFLGLVSFGIYTPRHAKVFCRK